MGVPTDDAFRRRWMRDVIRDQRDLRTDEVAGDELLTGLMKHCWPTKTNQNT